MVQFHKQICGWFNTSEYGWHMSGMWMNQYTIKHLHRSLPMKISDGSTPLMKPRMGSVESTTLQNYALQSKITVHFQAQAKRYKSLLFPFIVQNINYETKNWLKKIMGTNFLYKNFYIKRYINLNWELFWVNSKYNIYNSSNTSVYMFCPDSKKKVT